MSNDNYNQELFELLSAYLDNELNEHQLEKVAQLLQEDPQAQTLLNDLKTNSNSISSLLRETVPRDMTDEVLYVLERDTLLDGNDDMAIVAGERHLRFRNFMGAAAIFILVGAVFMVIFTILKPGKIQEENRYLAHADTRSNPEAPMIRKAITRPNSEIVEFNSIKDAARFIGQTDQEREDSEPVISSEITMARKAVPSVQVPLPQLPPMKSFEIPKPLWGSLKLSSTISSNDKYTIERLSNLLNRVGGDFLADSDSASLYTFAFVCRQEEFADFYMALRENLPGDINVQIDNVNGYSKVNITTVTGDEIIALAKFSQSSQQLEYAREIIPTSRFDFVEMKKKPVLPIWQQMATILPEQYQDKFSESLKVMLEPLPLENIQNIVSALEANPRPEIAKADSKTATDRGVKLNTLSTQPALAKGASLQEETVATDKTAIVNPVETETHTQATSSLLVANINESSEISTPAVTAAQAIKAKPEKIEADFIAIEIIISVNSDIEPEPEEKQPTSLIDILPSPLESRINFGTIVQ